MDKAFTRIPAVASLYTRHWPHCRRAAVAEVAKICDGRNGSWAQLRAGPCNHALRILLQAGEKRPDGDASVSLTVLRA